ALVREGEFGLRLVEETSSRTTMLLYAAIFLPQQGEATEQVLLAALNLKGAFYLVEKIQRALFEDRFYKGSRVGTVTIFMGPERIATTVLRKSGKSAIGTFVSDEVAEQTLQNGVPWTGRAWVVNDWYLSQYDPIRDASGDIIGMLYIGELEQLYLDEKHNTLWTSVSVVFGMMALALLISYLVSSRVFRQIDALEYATEKFAKGNLSFRAEVTTHDEIGDLANSFNSMAETIEKTQNQLLGQKEEIERINSNYMEMLGFVTHELRSTVSSALFNIGLLKDGSYGALQDDQEEGIDHVENSLRYLSELTNNYLQLSRIEKGELIINKTSVNLQEDVIEPVRLAFHRQLDNRDMQLVNEVPPDFTLPADANLLRVVYENLLGNAIKFGKEEGRIELDAYYVEEKTMALTIWNEGKRIDEERLPMLFKKFERYDVDERSGKQGSGLGLFIVQQIVKVHGGEIEVETQENDGVKFVITLPC
ncbi:HAMP domain-containing protein, partial [bacterium]|nr:HAMP domain-containing protein [bacterium]